MWNGERTPRRVFLSYTSELARLPAGRTFVDAAVKAVARAGDVVVEMSLFPASPEIPAEVCRQRIAACQLLLVVAGFQHGSLVPGSAGQSYVEWEYDVADECGRPRLAFLLDEKAQGPAELFVDPVGASRQHAFRERLRSDGVVGTFATPDELGMRVFHAVTATEVVGDRVRRSRPRVEFRDCTNVQEGDGNVMINYTTVR